MSLRKKGDPSKGPPPRKSMAGPMMLGNFGSVARRQLEEDTNQKLTAAPVQDYGSLVGRIKVNQVLNTDKELLCCKYSEDFKLLAVGCSDGSANFYATHGDKHFTLIDSDIFESNAPLTAMLHRPVSKNYPVNNTFTCSYGNGNIKCWNYNFQQCIYTVKENRECYGITYHPRYPKYITYGDDSKIFLYDEESRTQERVLSSSNSAKVTDGHTSRVFAACFNPRSNYELITGGWDDVVCFWDLRQPYAIRHLTGAHVCGESLDMNMRGTEILCGSFQKGNPLQVFDYASGKAIGKIESTIELGKLYTAKYLSKDFAVVGGTQPNSLSIVDLNTYTVVAGVTGLPAAIFCSDLGPAKTKFVSTADLGSMPALCFIAGKKFYEIDFI